MSTDVRRQFQFSTQRGNIREESLDRRDFTMLGLRHPPRVVTTRPVGENEIDGLLSAYGVHAART